jgi:SAM-dependent methyltransferase
MSHSSAGRFLGSMAKQLDHRFGIRAWLRGEPRPPSGGFDLDGEKLIDWGWICAHLPRTSQRALEIGCGNSPVLPTMLALGYHVTGVDPDPTVTRQISGFSFIQGDFNEVNLAPGFDVIVACSSIEHFGISGRYGSSEDESADLRAMRKIHQLLSHSGIVLLTVPVGSDAVVRPWHRIYGNERLKLLLSGFETVKSRFLLKQPWGPWHEVNRDMALSFPPDPIRYALGELMLRKRNAN